MKEKFKTKACEYFIITYRDSLCQVETSYVQSCYFSGLKLKNSKSSRLTLKTHRFALYVKLVDLLLTGLLFDTVE